MYNVGIRYPTMTRSQRKAADRSKSKPLVFSRARFVHASAPVYWLALLHGAIVESPPGFQSGELSLLSQLIPTSPTPHC